MQVNNNNNNRNSYENKRLSRSFAAYTQLYFNNPRWEFGSPSRKDMVAIEIV
jgi:hypothetical protein